jgi:dsRNA-specific ribonuclease
VIDMIVSGFIYTAYTTADEGALTSLRQRVVCNRQLAIAALRLGVHHAMLHSSMPLMDHINHYIDILQVIHSSLLFT